MIKIAGHIVPRPLCSASEHTFPQPTSQTVQLCPVRSTYIRGWVLGVARKIHQDILPIHPLLFAGAGVKKSEVWPQFSTPIASEAL